MLLGTIAAVHPPRTVPHGGECRGAVRRCVDRFAVTKMDIVEMLEKEIEWPSLVFFIMLFIVVGAAEQTGILQVIADWILDVCQGRLWIAVLLILWVSGITSAIVDNIPYTATMLPISAVSDQDHARRGDRRALVGPVSGRMFRRERDDHRGVGQRGDHRHS